MRYYRCRLRPSSASFTILTSVRPSRSDRAELLSIKETEFHEVDESVRSIVPSCLSITESDTASIGSCGSADLSYTPSAFENALFTSYVYKRNFRVPKIRRLFRRHQVEITNHSTAPHTDTVSICAPPEYISQASTTEQDESQATQEKIPTEDPTPDPDGLITRGEQESNTLLSAITSSIEGPLGEAKCLNVTREASQEDSLCTLPTVDISTPCRPIKSQEPRMADLTKVAKKAEVVGQIILDAQPKYCEDQHSNEIPLKDEFQELLSRCDSYPPQFAPYPLFPFGVEQIGCPITYATNRGNYVASIQHLRQGVDIMDLFAPDADLSESSVCGLLQELQNRDRTFFIVVMQRLAFQLGSSGIRKLVDLVSPRIEDIGAASSTGAMNITSSPLSAIFEDTEIASAARFRDIAVNTGMLYYFSTVLQLACVARKPAVVKYLLSMGIPELQMHWSKNPFILATKRRCIPILELFFKMANKHVSTNIRNLSLLMIVNKDCALSDHWTDPQANDQVRCAEDVTAVSLLLENGASPLAKTVHGIPVLHIAIQAAEPGDRHSLDIIRLIVLHGADVNASYSIYNSRSPLFLAVSMSSLAVVDILLENGANSLEARDATEFCEVMERLKDSLDSAEIEISKLLRANPQIKFHCTIPLNSSA